MTTPDTLTLSRMCFHAAHGALPSEKTHPQPWEVTVTLELPEHALREAAATDDLAKTTDYRRVHATVRAVMDGPPLNLAETGRSGGGRDGIFGHRIFCQKIL